MQAAYTGSLFPDRTGVLGSSEIAIAAGLNPYRSPRDLWLEKIGEREPFGGNEATEIGHLLEPAAAELFARRTGLTVRKPRLEEFPGAALDKLGNVVMVPHRDHVWAVASPDRLIEEEPAIVECKAIGHNVIRTFGDPGTDEIPAHYLAQVQWQLGILGRRVGYLAGLHGTAFDFWRVEFDPEFFEMLLEVGAEFMLELVANRREPPLDASKATGEWLKRKHPRVVLSEMLPANAEAEEWAFRLRDARRAVAAAEEAQALAEHHLKAIIGDAEGIIGPWGKITWRERANPPTTDWKRIATLALDQLGVTAAEREAMIEAHTKHREPSRVFLPRFEEE